MSNHNPTATPENAIQSEIRVLRRIGRWILAMSMATFIVCGVTYCRYEFGRRAVDAQYEKALNHIVRDSPKSLYSEPGPPITLEMLNDHDRRSREFAAEAMPRLMEAQDAQVAYSTAHDTTSQVVPLLLWLSL